MSTRWRLLIVTLVAVVVGVGVVVGVIGAVVRDLAADRVAEVLADAVPAEARAACRAGTPRPAQLAAQVRFEFFAIDGTPLTGTTALDRALVERLAHGARAAGRFARRSGAAHAVLRLDDAGPCAYAQASWHYARNTRRTVLGWLAGLAALIIAGTAALVTLTVARPLQARLAALRRSAAHVGSDAYVPAPGSADDAGDIGLALTAANRRIVADARTLADRQAALEWMLAEVGHDVRTPLASLQLALDELAERMPASALDILRGALADVVYLRSLTSNLGLASRLRADDWPAPRPIPISELAERAAERAAPFALRRGIDLEVAITPGLHILGDETSGEQVLTNLLENAIAHTAPGTHVSLVVAPVALDQVQLVVADDGSGIAPADLPRLGPVARNGARPREGRGTGLGLAITHEVCARAGWRVQFEAASPRGLRAVIVAPAVARPA